MIERFIFFFFFAGFNFESCAGSHICNKLYVQLVGYKVVSKILEREHVTAPPFEPWLFKNMQDGWLIWKLIFFLLFFFY